MRIPIVALLLLLVSAFTYAASTQTFQKVGELQQRWAKIKYLADKELREKEFSSLAERASEMVSQSPKIPELLIWEGIILSTYAGEKGGLGALKLVKKARRNFELAIELDPNALNGSAYTSLGALYYQVPGWPISFGSDKKARHLLQQALSIDPDGIDSNFFYGDFLMNEKEFEKAREVLQHALDAKDRPDRPIADTGRRQEIRTLLSRIPSNESNN